MLAYPIPHAVTQARVQLVADQTEKAPPHVIQADVLNVLTAKNDAERQALVDFKAAQANEIQAEQAQGKKAAAVQPPAVTPADAPHVKAPEVHVDVKA